MVFSHSLSQYLVHLHKSSSYGEVWHEIENQSTNCSHFESSLGTEHYAFYFRMGTKDFLTQSY